MVELDGVLRNEDGTARENETVETPVTVYYDGGETATTNLVINTAQGGVFGLAVPVDGSDGLVHNVTGVKIDALGDAQIAVATAPYALTAASVELISSNDYVPLAGDGIAIGNIAARSLSVTNSLDARSATSFTAGELKGFREIDFESIAVSGGTLDWLGGQRPASQSDAFANITEMTIGGGVPAAVEGTLSTGTSGLTRTWTAANDGFFQLQARTNNPQDGEVGLELISPNVTVTPMGRAGNKSGLRRLIWTVPVRKGQSVRFRMRAVSSRFELSSIKAQFIYFGVAE